MDWNMIAWRIPEWVIQIVFFNLCTSLFLVFIRLVIGPSLADRVMALDMFAIITASILAIHTIHSEEVIYLDVAITVALISFLNTVAFARYVQQRGRLRHKTSPRDRP